MGSRAQRSALKDNKGPSQTSEEKLDEALALTFPASDPPAQTQPIVHVGTKATNGSPPPRDDQSS